MDEPLNQAAGWLQLFDRYGVSLVALVGFAFATVWVLQRLLGKTDGILTEYGKAAQEAHQTTAAAVDKLKATNSNVAGILENTDTRLERIEQTSHEINRVQMDTSGPIATVHLTRCFLRGCDILETIADSMELKESIAPHLAVMRSDLQEHLAKQK